MVDLPLDFSCEPIQGQAPRQLENNRVDLQDVCFAYPEKPEQQILWHISLAMGVYRGRRSKRMRQIQPHKGDR